MNQPAWHNGAAKALLIEPSLEPAEASGKKGHNDHHRNAACEHAEGDAMEQPEAKGLNRVSRRESEPAADAFEQKAPEQNFFRKARADKSIEEPHG